MIQNFLVSLVYIHKQGVKKHIQEEYKATRQVHRLIVYSQFSLYFSQLFFVSLFLCKMSRECWFKLDLVSNRLGNHHGSPITPWSVLATYMIHMQTF